jgi:hypothetical protein
MNPQAKRDIQRKLNVLAYAEKVGNIRKACRRYGISRFVKKSSVQDPILRLFLLDLRPRVFQGDNPVEHRRAGL